MKKFYDPLAFSWPPHFIENESPLKAVCRKIGPALWKTGSTDFVKKTFLDNLLNFQHKLMILAQESQVSNLAELTQAQNP